MYIISPENANSSKIAVTNTATPLYTLMDTAGSIATSGAYYAGKKANSVMIRAEDGDIRWLSKVNPTSTVGNLIKNGSIHVLTNCDLTDLRLIRTGGSNVACSIQIGKSEQGESNSAVADSLRVVLASEVPESGTDATGQDTYATILTPSKTFSRILISNEGTNPATVSIDGGVTETFKRIPGGSVLAFDGVAITTAAIQAKNASAGNNYSNLTINVF